MRFDTIIIGGGLSGLTAGIALAKANQKVAVVSAGQSTLHFNSGSFDLLGFDDNGEVVRNPFQAISKLGPDHPYSKIGSPKIEQLATEAKLLLTEAGLIFNGDATENHYRLTPMGQTKPTWLTLDDFITTTEPNTLPWQKITVMNISGYLDFPIRFFVSGLMRMGAKCDMRTFTIAELENARRSPSEMRATNIAKVLQDDDVIAKLAHAINANANDADMILLPAVLGIANAEAVDKLKRSVTTPIRFVATMPPSVSGVRILNLLRDDFYRHGGTILSGDTVKNGYMENNRLISIETENLSDTDLEADNFVLATGSFMSGGLKANYEKIYEPVLGLDVEAASERDKWTTEYVFDAQPYMQFGVKTDSDFHAMRDGKIISNLFVAGEVLSGHDPLKQADGTGVSLLTALTVAKNILK
jgi:glycerol-3-phosphate dehydrogenase subunit B